MPSDITEKLLGKHSDQVIFKTMAPDSTEDHHNEIRGYKSTISNPKTSDEAKEHAQEKLKELDPENPDHKNKQVDLEGKDPSHVISGLKA